MTTGTETRRTREGRWSLPRLLIWQERTATCRLQAEVIDAYEWRLTA
jgi:hypothetical protein